MISIILKRVSKKKKKLIYHIIVISTISSKKKIIEKIGYYKPVSDFWQNKYLFIDIDKFLYWLCKGAIVSKKIFFLTKPLLLFYKIQTKKN